MDHGDITNIKAVPKTTALFISRIQPDTDKTIIKRWPYCPYILFFQII